MRGLKRDDVFYFVMATSNIGGGDAEGIDTAFRPYESDTVKVGMRVQILYMRTTKGAAADYTFDADFPASRKCGQRTIAEDNLSGVINHAIKHRLPVLFTLNGGIWADSACDVPEWDVNDFLESRPENDQWNDRNQVMPDDYLKNQPGSMESPELGRSLTFNIHARENRHYKKRNLQQAAKIIREFAARHPDLYIGISVDPDVYMNPFFEGQQWYDYNPGTLRQFREWLQGTGPYSGPTSDAPDLSSYRRAKPLTLAEVNELSGKQFARWDDVDPPRTFPVHLKRFWEDPWVETWDHFRRHLVDLHYDELSRWIEEVGIDSKSIYSAQGFMAPAPRLSPFPILINSSARNYDTGGMSVEGAVPAKGHLGAILYGDSAINDIKMEGQQRLFSVFRRLGPDWAVVEYNTANLREPARLPDFAQAYRSLREIHNHGARFVSPMAWNGSRGTSKGQQGFVSYTSLRDTPLEDAIKNFMISHANLPRQSRLWTFGTWTHPDSDGWVPTSGTTASVNPNKLALKANADGKGALESPVDLAFKPHDYPSMVIKTDSAGALSTISIEAETVDGRWISLVPPTTVTSFSQGNAGLVIPLLGAHENTEFSRVRLSWSANTGHPLVLEHIALYAR